MRDLVETVIGQVMKKSPTMNAIKSTTQPPLYPEAFQANRAVQPIDIKDQEMWGVCCQFEAIFLQQMMSAMRKTVPTSELSPPSYATSMYEGMMDQAISEAGSKQAPLGLALNMYRQLQQNNVQTDATVPSVQDIRQAADTLKRLDLVDHPLQGGV